jgi:hypothetical protein
VVETLGDFSRLLLNGNKDVTGLVVETLVRVVVTDLLDGISDNRLVIDRTLEGDLTEDLNVNDLITKTGEGELTMIIPVLAAVSQATRAKGSWMLVLNLIFGTKGTYDSETSIEDSIRDLITDLIGMSLSNRLGGEEEARLSVWMLRSDIGHYPHENENVRDDDGVIMFLRGE